MTLRQYLLLGAPIKLVPALTDEERRSVLMRVGLMLGTIRTDPKAPPHERVRQARALAAKL